MEIEARSTRGSAATRTSELRSERTHNMAEHNNDQAGNLPKQPHPALKQFDRLIGNWHISGPDV